MIYYKYLKMMNDPELLTEVNGGEHHAQAEDPIMTAHECTRVILEFSKCN